MSLYEKKKPNSGKEAHTMNVVVPEGPNRLLVATGVEDVPGATAEDRLRNFGKELLDEALTPNFSWGGDGQVTYVADPVGSPGEDLAELLRSFYDQRWAPAKPGNREKSYIIYDLDKPEVEVVALN